MDLPPPPALDRLRDDGPVALFLDFDGTLVDIADRPDAIEVPPRLAARLVTLSQRLEGRLALVSGRGLDDLRGHLGELAIARAGSHGASRFGANGRRLGVKPGSMPEPVVASLADHAARHGLLYEAKPHGGALHYRNVPNRKDGLLAFAQRLADDHGMTVKQGKGVVEVVAADSSKSGAVHAFMETEPFAGAHPVFVGDDVTDEDGFVAAETLGGFGIAVGERPSDTARYRLTDVGAVHAWLGL